MRRPLVPIIGTMERNESGIIVSWLLKVVGLLAVIGVVVFDIGSIAINTITLDSSADDVAVAVSIRVDQASGRFFTDPQVYQLAVEQVGHETDGVAGAKVLKNGTGIDDEGIVHVRLRRKAKTLITGLIGPLEKYTVGKADGQAGTN